MTVCSERADKRVRSTVFEAAADDPEQLDARTGSALSRIAALAAPYDG